MKKYLPLFILLLASILSANAQAPNWLWAKIAGGTELNYGKGIAADAGGNSYVTGFTEGQYPVFGNDTIADGGFVTKYDADGNVVWAKAITTPAGYGIAVDAINNSYIAGAGNNVFMVKCNSSGNEIWVDSLIIAGPGSITGNAIAVDGMGNSYVTGAFSNKYIVIGEDTLYSTAADLNNFFIVKCDGMGKVVWARTSTGDSSGSAGTGIGVDANGNCYVTGFNGSIGTDMNIFIARYDSSGNVLWNKNVNAFGAAGYAIAVDAGGNSYVTGYFRDDQVSFDTIKVNNTALASNDAFVVKYDASGKALWAHGFGGALDESGYGIAMDANENIYITGSTTSDSFQFGNTILHNEGPFVVSYDSAGNPRWGQTADGGAQGLAIAADKNDDCIITGRFWSDDLVFIPYDLAVANIAGNGDDDIIVAKIGSVVTGVERLNASGNFTAYPNPTNGFIHVTSTLPVQGRLDMFNIIGEKVYCGFMTGTSAIINCNLPDGMYILQLTNGDDMWTQKIVKQ